MTQIYQLEPCIEDDVIYFKKDNTIEFKVSDYEFSLELDSSSLAENVITVLDFLKCKQFSQAKNISIEPYSIEILINLLDSEFIISDKKEPVEGKVSGRGLICDVEKYYYRYLLASSPVDDFSLLLDERRLSEESLMRWSVQYHWVTSRAEQCLSSALSNPFLNESVRRQVTRFFFEETGHDKLIQPSVKAAKNLFETLSENPHISTLAVMGQFLSYALYDTPSFVSLIMVLEGSRDDSQRYIDNLNLTELSDTFKKGQIAHEMLNITGGHDNQARVIAASLPPLLEADVNKARKSVEIYYKTRAYMTPFLLDGRYHGSVSFDEIKDMLFPFITTLFYHTLPVAISSSSGDEKYSLIKMFSKLSDNDVKSIDDLDTVISNYFWALWIIAMTDHKEYLDTVKFLYSIFFSSEVYMSEKVNPTILESVGVNCAS